MSNITDKVDLKGKHKSDKKVQKVRKDKDAKKAGKKAGRKDDNNAHGQKHLADYPQHLNDTEGANIEHGNVTTDKDDLRREHTNMADLKVKQFRRRKMDVASKGTHTPKKNVFFQALPKLALPPLPSIRATWSSFFGRQKRRFARNWDQKRTDDDNDV